MATKSTAKTQNSPEKGEKKKIGAPTTYSEHITDVLCIRIGQGESLRRICMEKDMPDQSVVYDWLLRHPSFTEKYTRAREEQAETYADMIVDIADESPEINVLKDKEGNVIETKIDSGYVAYQKQRIESRKWTAMKLKPKKYGDRMQLAGDADAPLKVDMAIFDAILTGLEVTRQAKSKG